MMKRLCTPVAAHRRWLPKGFHRYSTLAVTVHR